MADGVVPAAGPDGQDACGRCDGPLGWIDDRWVCGDGATFCSDCRDELGGVCPDCSDPLRRERRAQGLPQGRPRPAEPFK